MRWAVEWIALHMPFVVGGVALAAAVVVAVLTWLAGRWAVSQRAPGKGLPGTRLERAGLVAALTLAGGSLAVFGALLGSYRGGGVVVEVDHVVLGALEQHTGPGIRAVFSAITRLGDVATITVLGFAVGGALLWCRRWLLCTAWAVTLAGGGTVNTVLKELVGRQRPEAAEAALGTTAWSFPSGHAMGATFAYGMLAYVLLRTGWVRQPAPVLGMTAALIVLVGSSRVVLQVHYLSDVLAGFAAGVAWLAVCLACTEQSLPQQ